MAKPLFEGFLAQLKRQSNDCRFNYDGCGFVCQKSDFDTNDEPFLCTQPVANIA